MKKEGYPIRVLVVLILAAVGGFILALPALAQSGAGTGGAMLLSTRLGDDFQQDIAYNPAGQFLVVWTGQEPVLDGSAAVYGQFYDAQGVPQGDNMTLASDVSLAGSPRAAYSPACGCYLVVWITTTSLDSDVNGLLLGSDGSVIVAGWVIYEKASAGAPYVPAVASNGTDFYVVWQVRGAPAYSIYGRRVNADGSMPIPAEQIAGGDGIRRDLPAIAYNPFAVPGEYLVVMQRDWAATGQVTARRVRADGSLPGVEYTVAAQPYVGAPAAVATPWDSSGAWVVVWDDMRNGTDGDVYGRVVLAGGEAAFDDVDFPISTVAGSWQGPVAIARSPTTGQFLVAYQDNRNGIVSDYDIYAQRLDAGAALLGPELVVSHAPDSQWSPAIAAGGSPDVYFVTWSDDRTNDSDIYGQRIAWNGTLLLSEFAIDAQLSFQGDVAMAYDWEHDQYLAVWNDYSGGKWAVDGQRLAADGLPLEAPWVVEADGHDNTDLDVAYSPDAHCFVAVWGDRTLDTVEGRQIPPAGDATVLFSIPDSGGGGGATNHRLAYDTGSTSFLVVWDGNQDIYAHALAKDGSPLAGDSTVVANTADWEGPAIVAADSANHRYLVVWMVNMAGAYQLYGHLVGPYGNLIGDPFPVAGGDGRSRWNPSLAYKPPTVSGAGQRGVAAAGEYLAVYQVEVSSHEYDLYGQRLDDQGDKIGGEILIYDGPAAISQVVPDVAYSPEAGRYYVVWAEDRGDGNDQDLYGRWLAVDGSPATAVLPFFRYPGGQSHPCLAYDFESQQALVGWEDSRTGVDYDVYAQLAAVDTTPPTAAFTRDPVVGKAGDTFIFNAWPSSDDTTPKVALAVRWDWTSNGSWDTAWSLDKYVEQTISLPNTYVVTLQVRDLMSQTDTVTQSVYVQPANPNTPPDAALTVSPLVGQAGASFTFNANGCSDAQTPAGSLEVRWDWENDGVWNTNYSTTKIRTHTYDTAGLYVVRVEVRDGGSLTDAALRSFLVLPAAPTALEVSPPAVTLLPGSPFQFSAKARDTYGNEMSNPPVTWSVTDPQAGTIDASGLFTAGLPSGLYIGAVVATWNTLSDAASVVIYYPNRVYLPVVLRRFP